MTPPALIVLPARMLDLFSLAHYKPWSSAFSGVIHVTGKYAEATNGHAFARMLFTKDELKKISGIPAEGLFLYEEPCDIDDSCDLLPFIEFRLVDKKTGQYAADHLGDRYWLRDGDGFPDVEPAIESLRGAPCAKLGIDSELLDVLCEAMGGGFAILNLPTKSNGCLENLSPIGVRVTGLSGASTFGVIMPVRV